MESVATFRYWSRLTMAETLPGLLQTHLDSKGLTLKTFAERVGISPSGLRKILRGEVSTVRGPTVAKLAKAFGVPPARVRAAIEASLPRE